MTNGLHCAQEEGKGAACPAVTMAGQGSNPHAAGGSGYKDPRKGRGPDRLPGLEPAQPGTSACTSVAGAPQPGSRVQSRW